MLFSKIVCKYLSIIIAVGTLTGMVSMRAQAEGFSGVLGSSTHLPAVPEYRIDPDWNLFYCPPPCQIGGRCLCAAYLVPGVDDRFMVRLDVVDHDKDGVVSPEEAASNVERRFYEMDIDSDNAVRFEEYRAFHAGSQTALGCESPSQKAIESRFKEEDKNNDGRLTKAEAMTAGKNLFEKSDINGDGKVDSFEFRAYR
jgi:hypothetical protein